MAINVNIQPGKAISKLGQTAVEQLHNRLGNVMPTVRDTAAIEDKTVADPKFTIDPDAEVAEVTSEIDPETNKFAAENLGGDLSVPGDIFQEVVEGEDISVDATSSAVMTEIEESRVKSLTTRLQELKL